MNRKSLIASVLALSLTGFAGAAVAADSGIQYAPFHPEQIESGNFPGGEPAHRTVSPNRAASLQIIGGQTSEGLQGMVDDRTARAATQTVDRAPQPSPYEQLAYSGR